MLAPNGRIPSQGAFGLTRLAPRALVRFIFPMAQAIKSWHWVVASTVFAVLIILVALVWSRISAHRAQQCQTQIDGARSEKWASVAKMHRDSAWKVCAKARHQELRTLDEQLSKRLAREAASNEAEAQEKPLVVRPVATAMHPISVQEARSWTPLQREKRLRAECYDSGICNDETLAVLLKAASSEVERSKLRSVVRQQAAPVIARAREIHAVLDRLEREASRLHRNPGYRETAACFERLRGANKELSPSSKLSPGPTLSKMALTLPGVSSLRTANVLVRFCMSCSDIAPKNCKDARSELDKANRELQGH